MSASVQHRPRAVDAPDAAADPAGEPCADRVDQRGVVPLTLCGVEVYELDPWEAGELENPRLGVRRFDGELLALHELNDVAALEVDRGD